MCAQVPFEITVDSHVSLKITLIRWSVFTQPTSVQATFFVYEGMRRQFAFA